MLAFKPQPHLDESLNGFLLRLAEENFIDSAGTLLRSAKVRYKGLYTREEVAAITDTLGLDEAIIKSLVAYDAVNGSLAQGRFLRTASVPVCVSCLQQEDYIRQSWHHQLITACPVHNIRLLATCPECDEPLDLKRASIMHCRCGYRLTDAPTVKADEANLFVAGVLERGSEVSCAGLNSQPPDIDSFLLYLANLTLETQHRKNAPIDWERAQQVNQASYSIAVDLLPRFRSFVLERVRAANERTSSRFMASLGPWYRELNAAFAGDAYAPVRVEAYRVILEHAQAPINRKMKQIGAELLGMKALLTAAEVARTLKTSADRVVALVKNGALPGVIVQAAANEFCMVQRSDVEAHQQAAADYVNAKELLKILGTTRRVRDRLFEAGLLHPVSADQRPLFARGDFSKKEALGLLSTLSDGCPEIDHTVEGICLADISEKRFSRQQANELLGKIFSGEIKPLGRVSKVYGLSGFVFDEAMIVDTTRDHTKLIELTITELTKITRWKHQTIKGWIDAGFLIARVDPSRNQVLVSLPNLISFLSTHVVAADAAERMDSKSVWLMRPLMTAGVLAQGTHDTKAGTRRGVLFSTDALINVASKRTPKWSRPSASKQQPRSDLALSAVVDRFCGSRS